MIFKKTIQPTQHGQLEFLSSSKPKPVKHFVDLKVRARILARAQGSIDGNPKSASPVSKPKRRILRCFLNQKKVAPNDEERNMNSFGLDVSIPLETTSAAHNVTPTLSSWRQGQQARPKYRLLLDRSTLVHQPLKYSRKEEQEALSKEPARKRKVRFGEETTIVKIHSHRHYPESIKQCIWRSRKEIKANAIRNTAEYIYDRCNWRNCTEEEGMYIDERNGTLVHPVHVQRYFQEQAKRAAQQQQHEQARQQSQVGQQAPLLQQRSNMVAPQQTARPLQPHFSRQNTSWNALHPRHAVQQNLRCSKRMPSSHEYVRPAHHISQNIPQIV